MGKLIATVSIVCILFGVGCATLSSYITPATVDQEAVAYVEEAGLSPQDFEGYQNLEKAERLKDAVDNAHSTIQFDLTQKAQKDSFDYSIHRDVVSSNLAVGQQREEMLFGPTGLLSMGLSMAGFGTLTGYVGLMRKRPGDIVKEEAEKLIASASTEKEKQLVEVVMGVKKFMDTFPDPKDPTLLKLKTIFSSVQNTQTEVAVATILKEKVA
jgi:hypothetical protein